MKDNNFLVGIILGSASDLELAKKAGDVFESFGVRYEVGIASAHRTPQDVVRYAESAAARGVKVIIAIAGLSAALPGVIAAHTNLPVIGVPAGGASLNGIDALLSIAQMPPGVPVASVGIDGARNAALMTIRILSLLDNSISLELEKWVANASLDVRKSREKITMPRVPDDVYAG
ncbi:MAG: 5-(carboxyamino)imidazole ribonucleotide mutase [Synergistaceae bacterium]|nr:5-(carboxyamino)imidazole ribonucleotide mutase [Synergistaceae bacterium]